MAEMDPMSDYNAWKDSFPLIENTRKEESSASVQNVSPSSMTSVFQKILSYPIESKSPIESMLFLAEIKKDLSSLI